MKLYTSNVVADWLAVTPRRVRQLRDEGVIAEKAPGLYELQSCVVRYISYLRKGNGSTNLNDERAMLTKAKREAADMENEERRGNLHSTGDIEKGAVGGNQQRHGALAHRQRVVPEYARALLWPACEVVRGAGTDGRQPGGHTR